MYFVWLGGERINPQSMSTNNQLNCTPKTDRRKCCLCQTNTKEELRFPHNPLCSSDSDAYSMIAKKKKKKKKKFPTKTSSPKNNITYESLPSLLLTKKYEWLQKVSLTQVVYDNVNITWSAHHAEKKRGLAFEVSITALLPLLCDKVHTVATVRHPMNEVRDTIIHLKPGQVPVITANQPIYALIKKVQWHWPNLYDKVKFVCLGGPSHRDGQFKIS